MQQWLQELVKRLDTTQAGLAKKVGRSHTSVYRWVSGEIVPDPDSCRRLARVAGVSEDFVLRLAGHRTANEEPIPPRLAYVVERVQAMPPAMQGVVTDAIVEVVEAFSKLERAGASANPEKAKEAPEEKPS
ncbi:MAG: helix-turn-helix transcriptional regulator [Anaerolineae bacterium]